MHGRLQWPHLLAIVQLVGEPVNGAMVQGCSCSSCVEMPARTLDAGDAGCLLVLVSHREVLPDAVKTATWAPVCECQAVVVVPAQVVSNAVGREMLKDLHELGSFVADHPVAQALTAPGKEQQVQPSPGRLGCNKGGPTAALFFRAKKPAKLLHEPALAVLVAHDQLPAHDVCGGEAGGGD